MVPKGHVPRREYPAVAVDKGNNRSNQVPVWNTGGDGNDRQSIALITGYIISREGTDDTLKNILTIPLSFPALLVGKLFVCGLLSLFLGIVSAVFTVSAFM